MQAAGQLEAECIKVEEAIAEVHVDPVRWLEGDLLAVELLAEVRAPTCGIAFQAVCR
jgi:hypothetical protein